MTELKLWAGIELGFPPIFLDGESGESQPLSTLSNPWEFDWVIYGMDEYEYEYDFFLDEWRVDTKYLGASAINVDSI